MCKCINYLTPSYLYYDIVWINEIQQRSTRAASRHNLFVPPHNSKKFQDSFIYQGSIIRNNLPVHVRKCTRVSQFKYCHKSYYWFNKDIPNP